MAEYIFCLFSFQMIWNFKKEEKKSLIFLTFHFNQHYNQNHYDNSLMNMNIYEICKAMHSFLVALKSKSRFHVVFLLNWLLREKEGKMMMASTMVLMLMAYKTKKA